MSYSLSHHRLYLKCFIQLCILNKWPFMLWILVTIEMDFFLTEHCRNPDWQFSLPKQFTDSFDFLVTKS